MGHARHVIVAIGATVTGIGCTFVGIGQEATSPSIWWTRGGIILIGLGLLLALLVLLAPSLGFKPAAANRQQPPSVEQTGRKQLDASGNVWEGYEQPIKTDAEKVRLVKNIFRRRPK